MLHMVPWCCRVLLIRQEATRLSTGYGADGEPLTCVHQRLCSIKPGCWLTPSIHCSTIAGIRTTDVLDSACYSAVSIYWNMPQIPFWRSSCFGVNLVLFYPRWTDVGLVGGLGIRTRSDTDNSVERLVYRLYISLLKDRDHLYGGTRQSCWYPAH